METRWATLHLTQNPEKRPRRFSIRRRMGDDLAVFRSTEGSTEASPRHVGVETTLQSWGSMLQRSRASGTGGSSKQPHGSWSGGTHRRKLRARSAGQPGCVTNKSRNMGGASRETAIEEGDLRQDSKAPGLLRIGREPVYVTSSCCEFLVFCSCVWLLRLHSPSSSGYNVGRYCGTITASMRAPAVPVFPFSISSLSFPFFVP